MQYSIDGRNCELLRVELNDTEGVLAEVGTLIFMRGEVTWNVVLPGRGVAGKIAAGIKRKIGVGRLDRIRRTWGSRLVGW